MSALTFPGIKLDDKSLALRKRVDELAEQLAHLEAYMGTLTPEQRATMRGKRDEAHEVIKRIEKQLIIL